MKMELIPTVQSLLKQDAICIRGDNVLIEKFTDLVSSESFEYELIPIFNIDNCLFLNHNARKIPLLSDSIDRPFSKNVLYSISLQPEKFEVLVHAHSASGSDSTTKPIYTVINPNVSKLENAFIALYNHIDDSTHFLICQHCKQLVAAELCSDNTCGNSSSNELNDHQHCETTYKQAFDTSLVDRISCRCEVVSVFKDIDNIKLYVFATAWPNPHEPVSYNDIIATLPLTATLDEVNALRLKLEDEQEYPAPCFHCKCECDEGDAMGLNSLVDFDTDAIVCYSCATEHYGVIY
tara:strand:+ start:38021 stop:38899 length:879 start_codon:yes stop_codon:yes gene_type:complete